LAAFLGFADLLVLSSTAIVTRKYCIVMQQCWDCTKDGERGPDGALWWRSTL